MLDMLDTMKSFCMKRNLTLSTEKTKILIFNKGKNAKKERWLWKDNELEEVKEFKYLGFTFNRNGSVTFRTRDK